jgi:hypothetical protein
VKNIVERYNVYLEMLQSYLRRNLTYESDVINAFSGIMKAEERNLGQFRWGLPSKIFARALLLEFGTSRTYMHSEVRDHQKTLEDVQIDYPSWSWFAWRSRVRDTSGVEVCDAVDRYRTLFVLVHIYGYDENASLVLLLGPRDVDRGIESYCATSIRTYNSHTDVTSLPVEPSLADFASSQRISKMYLIYLFSGAMLLALPKRI